MYREKACSNKLRIITFGNFDIRDNKGSLTDQYSSSLKVWELFKFLITYRDELILPEKIIESIWPDADYQDPKRTLRALVFRLRKILGERSGGDGKDIIIHSQGCYKLVTGSLYYIDAIEFETLFDEANKVAVENPTKAIELYYGVIGMYKKGYLNESYEYEWLIPARNCYRRIFLQSVIEIAEILKEEKEYQQIVVICQGVLKYERLEEGIHFQYIEALAKMGQINQAKNHYEYVVDIFERELGIKPSHSLNKLYRMISGNFERIGNDTNAILERLVEGTESSGAILCGPEFFKLQYQLEKGRYERDGKPIYVGLLTISPSDSGVPSEKQLKYVMQELRNILLTTLRKGDVVAQWNKSQFIINLPGPSIDKVNIAIQRIHNKFTELEQTRNLTLYMKLEEIWPINQ